VSDTGSLKVDMGELLEDKEDAAYVVGVGTHSTTVTREVPLHARTVFIVWPGQIGGLP
jgi:hypothetical protein